MKEERVRVDLLVLARAAGGHLAHVVPLACLREHGRRARALCGFRPSRSPISTMNRHGWRITKWAGSPCPKCKSAAPDAYGDTKKAGR